MCTRYISPATGDIERHWHVGAGNAPPWVRDVFPRYTGPFIRAARDSASCERPQGRAAPSPPPVGVKETWDGPAFPCERELVVGQWALVPWFAKAVKLPYLTCNARSEEMATKASYKLPWARGQRCIIPAQAFFEPNWESGKHVPWRFERADGKPWSLAGLWNTWVDKASGEVVESYTMLTINADAHPLMKRMHKPDPQLAPDQQDKRSVIVIEPEDIDLWLTAPTAQAQQLLRLAPVEVFDAQPVTG